MEDKHLIVLISGVFHAAFDAVLPQLRSMMGVEVSTKLSPSMGDSEQSVENRLSRGEEADVLIMAGGGMDAVISKGMVLHGTRVELARAPVGLAMKAGASKPDISTVESLRATLLAASSVGYSISASGRYVSGKLFETLGIEDGMRGKAHEVEGLTPVAETVARGENQYGFQAISELMPTAGIEVIGRLPEAVEFVTPVSGAVVPHSQNVRHARLLLHLLTKPERGEVFRRHGLEHP